jgi:hypothetical protein
MKRSRKERGTKEKELQKKLLYLQILLVIVQIIREILR